MAGLGRPVVTVVVHTDRRGSATDNLDLSVRRAAAVVDYLEGRGVQPGRLVAVGAGESFPLVVPEVDDADYARNRRVLFEVADQ